MKAYSYIRFSTPQQAEGDSLRRQLDLSDKYANQHNLEIDDRLRITDFGKSAYKEKHLSEGALGEFLKAVEAGEVERGSYLLVESLDRLSRACVPKALRLFLNLLEHGIKIVTLGDERCYSEQSVSKDMTEMIISIAIMSRAHEESQRKAQRVAAAWQAKRNNIGEKKLSRNCPRWLRLSEDRKSFELIPERVKLVKEIFDLTIEGLGRQAIATRINRRSEPVWNKPRKLDPGWHPAYIHLILQNRAVIGCYQPYCHSKEGEKTPAGEEIVDYFPAIIDEATYYAAKSQHTPRGRYGGSVRINNLLTNLIYDSETGEHVRYQIVRNGKGQDWSSLRSDAARRTPGSQVISWSYAHFEAAFLKFIGGLGWRRVTGQTKNSFISAKQAEQTMLEGKIEELEERIDKLADAISTTDDAPAALIKKIATIEAEKTALDTQLAEVRKAIQKLEREEQRLHQNQEKLQHLIAANLGSINYDVRVRLREEIQRKIKKIMIRPEKTGNGKRPSFMVIFINGTSTWVSVSPVARGKNAAEQNRNPDAQVISFQAPGEGVDPLLHNQGIERNPDGE